MSFLRFFLKMENPGLQIGSKTEKFQKKLKNMKI